MTKNAKRRIASLLLVLVLAAELLPLPAFAHGSNGIAGNGTWGVYIDIYGPAYQHYASKAYGGNAYGRSGCAWFACSRAYELTGIDTVMISGASWYSYRYAQYGYTRGRTIREKSIVCYSNHTAFVEAIRGNKVLISEGGWPAYQNDCCILQVKTIAEVEGRGGFLGYVYLPVKETLSVDRPTFPDAIVGEPYRLALTATGGNSVSWSLADGALPLGLALDANGVISGTPLESGSFSFTVKAKSGSSTASSTFILAVTEPAVTALALVSPQSPAPLPFADVAEGDWCYEGVRYVYQNELMGGISDRLFAPYRLMTRQMLWAVLARLNGADMTGNAYDAGRAWVIAQGVSDGKKGSSTITREQLATMLYRVSGEPEMTGSVSDCTDCDKISPYAEDALCWMREKGLIGGYADGTLRPQANATRAQVAAILQRMAADKAAEEEKQKETHERTKNIYAKRRAAYTGEAS